MAVAIVLAAGSGSRMQSDVAKQYLKLQSREVLFYSLDTMNRHPGIEAIVVVVRENETDYCKNEIIDRYGFDKVKKVCVGGRERFHSVYNGLKALDCKKEKQIVLVHDGARPFVTARMIDDVISAAEQYGSCTVAMPVKDTIEIVDGEEFGTTAPSREKLRQIQTPQAFSYDLLKGAYEEMFAVRGYENYKITDDTMLVNQYKGVRPKVVTGSYENIKITTQEDMEIAAIFAEKFFQKNPKIC